MEPIEQLSDKELLTIIRRAENTNIPGSLYQRAQAEWTVRSQRKLLEATRGNHAPPNASSPITMFLNNVWVVTIGGGLAVALLVYLFFGTDRGSSSSFSNTGNFAVGNTGPVSQSIQNYVNMPHTVFKYVANFQNRRTADGRYESEFYIYVGTTSPKIVAQILPPADPIQCDQPTEFKDPNEGAMLVSNDPAMSDFQNLNVFHYSDDCFSQRMIVDNGTLFTLYASSARP